MHSLAPHCFVDKNKTKTKRKRGVGEGCLTRVSTSPPYVPALVSRPSRPKCLQGGPVVLVFAPPILVCALGLSFSGESLETI